MFKIDRTKEGFAIRRESTDPSAKRTAFAHFAAWKDAVKRSARLYADVNNVASDRLYSELFGVGADQSDHDGVMIGFFFDQSTAEQLRAAVPGFNIPDPHITLAYVGKVAELGDADIATTILSARNVALNTAALVGKLGGVGTFNASASSDGAQVLYAVVDVPKLEALRSALVEQLSWYGTEVNGEHGFNPHVTLYYVPSGGEVPVVNLPDIPIRIDRLMVCVGGRRTEFALTGGDESNTYSDIATVCARGHAYRLFTQLAPSDAHVPDWIPYLPKPGQFDHPTYGAFEITAERIGTFVQNFNAGIYQSMVPLDLEHETKVSGAAGWIKQLRQNSDGGADALVEWTDRGKASLAEGRFKYVSPEWFDVWVDPLTGEEFTDVCIGGALTTRPFFKESSLRPLIASEAGFGIKAAGTDDIVLFNVSQIGDHTMAVQNDKTAAAVDSQQFAELEKRFAEMSAKLDAAQQRAEAADARAKKFEEDLAEAQSTIGDMEADALQTRLAALASGWEGDTASHVAILAKLGEGTPEFDAYVQMQNAKTAQSEEESELFSERGTSQGGNAKNTEEEVKKRVSKVMSEGRAKTEAEAVGIVFGDDPKLYEAYRAKTEQKV